MRKSSSFLRNHGIFIYLFILSYSITIGISLEFRNKAESNYKTIQLGLNKKAVSHLTPHNGLIIDKPKIRILNYRVRNSDPWAIIDDTSCVSGIVSGRASVCDELIEIGNNRNTRGVPKRLGEEDGETAEWLLPPNVTQIVIECTSKSGPVEWDYDGKGIFPDIEIDNMRQTGDFWTETTYTHISQFIIKKVSDQLTGKYICRNVNKPLISNSFYMFVPQEKLEIYNNEQVIKITPPSHAAQVIIPCRLDSHDTSVHLYKKMPDGTVRKISMNDEVTFDPYIGFRMRLSRNTFGHYLCKVDKKNDDFRTKREIALFMTPPVETSTSPGILAFPTSDEIVDLLFEERKISKDSQSTSLEQLVENPTMHSQLSQDEPTILPTISTGSSHLKRRRNRPFMRRRTNPNANTFHHRGGPPPSGPNFNHRPPPHMFRRRSPVPGSFNFRHRPPPNTHIVGPFPMHHYRPFQHYHGQFPPQGMPGKFGHQPPSAEEGLDKEPNQGQSLQNTYLHPSPIISHPPSVKPIKVLPTFITKSGQHVRPSEITSSEEKTSEIKLPIFSSEVGSLSKFSGFNEKISRNKSSSYSFGSSKPPRKGAAAILSQNLLPQTMTIVNSMQCVLKKVIMGPDAHCNGSFFEPGIIRRRPVGPINFGSDTNLKDQTTILEVDIIHPPDNKFFPKENVLYTTIPFFVKWQTRYTDYADWAEVNHTLKEGTYKRHKAGVFEDGINSFEVFDLAVGESGKISVAYMGDKKEILVHTWKYFIINNTLYNAKGLKHREEENLNIFTCRSTSANKPSLTLKKLSEDGCPINADTDSNKVYKKSSKQEQEEDCGPGCVMLKTDVSNGIVSCNGDGIDDRILFPADVYCTGRPYFVEREKSINLTIQENQKRLNLPCVINNPNADVYLFHETLNETIEDVTDRTTYDLKSGFSLDLSKISDPLGTYVCTSTTTLEDDTDMVTYYVTLEPAHVFHPSGEKVFGIPPFKFSWESTEKLEVENKSMGNFYSGIFAKPEGNRQFVGTFDITSLEKGQSGEVVVLRSSDKKVVHTWHYRYAENARLWLDKKKNVFRCKSSSEDIPTLFAVECSNPNVCKFKKRFIENEKQSSRDNSLCGEGCAQLKIWGNKPTGFVKCKGDGINDSLNYFLSSQNSTLFTGNDNLENFKTPEIVNVVRKLRVGETSNFVCRANKYFYSKGFQWAVESRNGSKIFVDLKIKDDDSYLNEIRSEISLKIGDHDWKAVWCFAPLIVNNQWGNVSQPIYIKL